MTKKSAVEAKPKPVGIYFNDGCVRHEGTVQIAGKLKGVDPDEYTFSRMSSYAAWDDRKNGPRWGHVDYPGWNVVSVCHFTNAPFSAADGWNGARYTVLSTAGDVGYSARAVPPIKEQIADVQAIGAVSQIRQIGDRLYVCGMQGQVYRRDEGGWVHIDQGILDRKPSPDALHLNGIAGTSDRDIYVVGLEGKVLHFDGKAWRDLQAPTNLHLERVHCVSPSEVYVCGNRGTFFKISNGAFTDFSPKIDDHFWGMTAFQGQIYLATLKGLHVFDGKQVRPVDTKLDPPIGGYRLDACETQLWSFGVDDLAWFDGKTWTRLQDPDNA